MDYGDNGAQETDKSVTGGSVSLEQNELTLEEKSFLLGHKLGAEKKELVYDANDVAPYVGIGAIGTSKRGWGCSMQTKRRRELCEGCFFVAKRR